MKEDEIKLLKHIAEFEATHDMVNYFPHGWAWHHVGIAGATLSQLYLKGYLEMPLRSGGGTWYRLNDKGRLAIADAQAMDELQAAQTGDSPLTPPKDMFADVVGHEDVKELLRACLLADRQVHVLLTGPPALAKSIFLWDIERAYGDKALWLLGSATSRSGLWDVLAEREPQVLLIDELDKAEARDQAALLSITEGGRVVRAKVGRELELNNPIRVIAASNRLEKISPELRSRFGVKRLNPYSQAEYRQVVKGVLISRENVSQQTAEEIAKALEGHSQNVRDAIRVARLAPHLGVAKAVKLLLEGE